MERSADSPRTRSADLRRPLVVGVGQALRGDDAAGRCVAEALLAEFPDEADVVSTVQLVPELAEAISRAAAVVFVDSRIGGEPGLVEVEPLAAQSSPPHSSHAVSPQTLLYLAASLFGRVPPTALASVAGSDFELGAAMSPQVRLAVPAAVQAVRRWLADQVADPSGGPAARLDAPGRSESQAQRS